MIGAGIITFYPITGFVLVIIYLLIEIKKSLDEQNEHERKERFDFEVAKSLVKTGAGNPFQAEIEDELKKNGKLMDIIPKYKKFFEVDPFNQDALSKILAGYAMMLNQEIRMYDKAQRHTLIEAKKYVSIALKRLKGDWHTQSLINIAMIYDAGQYFEKSGKIYKRLLKSEPENISVIDSCGMSYLMRGNVFEAVDILEASVKKGNFTFLTLYNLGAAEHELGHFSVSTFYLNISYRLHRDWKSLYLISKNSFLMGHFKEAFIVQFLSIISGGLEQKRAVTYCFNSLFLGAYFGLLLLLSLTVGRIPFIKRYYYKFFKPGQQFEEIVRIHVEKHYDAHYHSAKFMEELLIIDPNNQSLLYNLAIFNGKLGNKLKMVECFRKLEKSETVNRVVDELTKLSETELKQQNLSSVTGDLRNL